MFNFHLYNNLDDLKSAFRELAKTYHPDAGGTEEMFKLLNGEYIERVQQLKGHFQPRGSRYAHQPPPPQPKRTRAKKTAPPPSKEEAKAPPKTSNDPNITYGMYKGHKMIQIKMENGDTFSFGQRKAKLILQHLEAIRKFAEGQEV